MLFKRICKLNRACWAMMLCPSISYICYHNSCLIIIKLWYFIDLLLVILRSTCMDIITWNLKQGIFIIVGHCIAVELERINFHCKYNLPISLEILGNIKNMEKRVLIMNNRTWFLFGVNVSSNTQKWDFHFYTAYLAHKYHYTEGMKEVTTNSQTVC